MIFTSDKEFFDKIGIEETKRYFEKSYKFICNYKSLEKKILENITLDLPETPNVKDIRKVMLMGWQNE